MLLTATASPEQNTQVPMSNLGRSSSFQRSLRRSSSLTRSTPLAILGPGDSFGEEAWGLPTQEDSTGFVITTHQLRINLVMPLQVLQHQRCHPDL